MTFLAILTVIGAVLNIALAILTVCSLRDNARRMDVWRSQEANWHLMLQGRVERLERGAQRSTGGQTHPTPGKAPERRSRDGR